MSEPLDSIRDNYDEDRDDLEDDEAIEPEVVPDEDKDRPQVDPEKTDRTGPQDALRKREVQVQSP